MWVAIDYRMGAVSQEDTRSLAAFDFESHIGPGSLSQHFAELARGIASSFVLRPARHGRRRKHLQIGNNNVGVGLRPKEEKQISRNLPSKLNNSRHRME